MATPHDNQPRRALLLLGGFFYQRLSDHLAAPDPPGPRVA